MIHAKASSLVVAAFAATILVVPLARAAEHVVEIRGFVFVSGAIDVQPGDTITWINYDIVPHTATAIDGSWDSGEIAPGDRKSLHLPPSLTRSYVCLYHGAMRGSL